MAKKKLNNPSRRQFLKWGTLAGGSIMIPMAYKDYRGLLPKEALANEPPPSPSFTPFTRYMPIPSVLQEVSGGGLDPEPGTAEASVESEAVYHGIAKEFLNPDPMWKDPKNEAKHYEIFMEEGVAEIIPGMYTPVFTYRDGNQLEGSGKVPGPTILADFNEPIVVRHHNNLMAPDPTALPALHDVEASVHLHGGHSPAHADGYPDFYVLTGKARDYYYPNIVPKRRMMNGNLEFDKSVTPSTMWYHDHGMDVTGFTVSSGLAAFYLMKDEREIELTEPPLGGGAAVLPEFASDYDIPIVLIDQRFNADGTAFYDFLDHAGRLGDVFTANGVAQPKFTVERRKYRFRILNGSNARVYQLRLSTGQPFLIIGNDSWLLPEPFTINGQTGIQLAMAERAELIIDFKDAPDEVYLENIMLQTDGRGPDEVDPNQPTPLIKFVVQGANVPNDVSVAPGTPLRDHEAISAGDVVATRHFKFDRSNGAWTVNNRFFNPRRADAVPMLDPDGINAEEWTFENSSGGWWHPIHVHLEHHEILSINGYPPPPHRQFKSDVSTLGEGDEIKMRMRFRTFDGPFVFHCHNLEHEDMRMMGVFEVLDPQKKPILNGQKKIPQGISGVPDTCQELEDNKKIFFDVAGDVDRLEDEGVGFPCTDFDLEP